MKVLVVGDWHSELHEEAVHTALLGLGHESIRFGWHQYFKAGQRFPFLSEVAGKAQNKYMLGPLVSRLNADLRRLALSTRPDALFVYRGTHVLPSTLKTLKDNLPGMVLVGYNNDDPFSPQYPMWKWRHFLRGVPLYDLVLAYRQHNLNDFERCGAREVRLLRSWFIPSRNRPVVLNARQRRDFECDVVFAGHFEDDGRLALLEEIARQGWRLRIFGPGHEWDELLKNSPVLNSQGPVRQVWGDEYNAALCGAKVALCFFSRLNRDTYTRRCFEIPASGTVLASEYSDDLAHMFEDGREAILFRNADDMVSKIKGLLNDDEQRQAIATAGRMRVWRDGHDVGSRMQNVVNWIQEISSGRVE
ncbi:MAG: glycosyltransferase [Aquabacterium sp.]|uniref:CgeB family protein n=1 Tax=Aquabacterium sp. TaxID=1872578 RepID=UPI0025BE2AA6|nr:glycosyltransferase [Aquabacterium sp.]MBI5925023.1 glycosyltransferase [Aquabacterium sp.]